MAVLVEVEMVVGVPWMAVLTLEVKVLTQRNGSRSQEPGAGSSQEQGLLIRIRKPRPPDVVSDGRLCRSFKPFGPFETTAELPNAS